MKPTEILLAWFTGVIALFGLTVLFCKPAIDSWWSIRDRKEMAQDRIQMQGEIDQAKKNTEARLQELQKKVNPLPTAEMPNVSLPRIINNLAGQSGVTLKDTRIGDVWQIGRVNMLPIKYAWGETDTKSIKSLLIALQENDIIFDVVEITVRSAGQDRLSGSLTVNCVYTK